MFSCNVASSRNKPAHLVCLRGSSISDGVKDCADNSDESRFRRKFYFISHQLSRSVSNSLSHFVVLLQLMLNRNLIQRHLVTGWYRLIVVAATLTFRRGDGNVISTRVMAKSGYVGWLVPNLRFLRVSLAVSRSYQLSHCVALLNELQARNALRRNFDAMELTSVYRPSCYATAMRTVEEVKTSYSARVNVEQDLDGVICQKGAFPSGRFVTASPTAPMELTRRSAIVCALLFYVSDFYASSTM